MIVIGPWPPPASDRRLYRPSAAERWASWARVPWKVLAKVLIPIMAIWGRYPKWAVTPDDPVSPFGCGTTKGASREPTMVKIYEKLGRWAGDSIWLGWRNSGYGLAYMAKPDWLKRPGIRYMDLPIVDERTPAHRMLPVPGDPNTYDDNNEERVGTLWVQCPDGTWLTEKTRKFGPIYVVTGYRLSAIASGKYEDEWRISKGWGPVPRPVYHPNMDARPIVSFRTARTM